jgi:hypothetical protein
MIRARMADARSMAMEQGKPFRFGFMPGTGRFQVAADDSSLWSSTTSSGAVDSDEQICGELPAEMLFAANSTTISSGNASAGGNWAMGGVFLPDGTARGDTNSDGTYSDDVTFYFGKSGIQPMAIRLRGLTGIVRVFDPAAEGNHP